MMPRGNRSSPQFLGSAHFWNPTAFCYFPQYSARWQISRAAAAIAYRMTEWYNMQTQQGDIDAKFGAHY
jgi:hypothetical protein